MPVLSERKRGPLLCYVTDLRAIPTSEPQAARIALLERITAAATAGVEWIQIREKHLTAKECSVLVREALQCVETSAATSRTKTRVLVNDRLDVALAARADGVHLGEQSLPPENAKRLARERGRAQDFLVGVSCHSLEAAKAAEQCGADYIIFGPTFATPSKAAYGAPQGIERLAEVCRAVSIPVLAIGGITVKNCASCISAGAAGIAAIRLFQDAGDIAKVVQVLRKIST